MDSITEFAELAGLALADITDPDATQHAADEALASLEHSVPSLPRTHRAQGALISRTLYQMRIGNEGPPCDTLTVLTYMRTALGYARMGGVYDLWKAGETTAYALIVVAKMPIEQLELRQLLRCIVGATERAAVELVIERQHGGVSHVAA